MQLDYGAISQYVEHKCNQAVRVRPFAFDCCFCCCSNQSHSKTAGIRFLRCNQDRMKVTLLLRSLLLLVT
jgi:hypothetical protein